MSQIEFFNSYQNRLSYVCTLSDEQKIKAGLIFVHAGGGNRLGPHRMFVEFADRLKHCGITSFRFDMRGCGDSEGEPARNDTNLDIEDLQNAIRFFISKYKLPKVFLFGISRGAQVSIAALADHNLPINGAVLLSTIFSNSKAAAKKFTDRLKEYLYKLTDPESRKKLLTGKANLKQIAKTLAFALCSRTRYRKNSNGFATKCPLLFIYGSKDPTAADSAIYYSRICRKYETPYKITEVENANHSFFHYKWKEQIFEMTENWLTENINFGNKDGILI